MMNDEYNDGTNDYQGENLLDQLKRAWINEKFAPNLLQYQQDTIKQVLDLIEEKESLISSGVSNINDQFTANIYEMEIERLKYIIKCYLVIRIKKIDQFYASILSAIERDTDDQDETSKLLSDFELEYCQKYKTLMDNYFKNSLLNSIPKDYQKVDINNLPKPFLNSFVFCKPRYDLGDCLIDEDTVDFKKSSIYFLKYGPIKEMVEGGKMDLI